MATPKPNQNSSKQKFQNSPEFWKQLEADFPFEVIEEELLRQQTEQWISCANELLGSSVSRTRNHQNKSEKLSSAIDKSLTNLRKVVDGL